MKQTNLINCRALRWGVVTLLLLVVSTTSNAYDFASGVIYYNILSSSDKTCEVTYKNSNYNSYSGNVVIPETVKSSGTTYTVKVIGNSAFRDCSGLTSITIPENVTSIGYGAFCGCKGLTSIYTLNPEPPTCGKSGIVDTFCDVNQSTCTLYVPEGSLGPYFTASQWQDFLNIVEFDVTPVSGVMADGNAEAVGYYTTDGRWVSTPRRSVNIIRYSDGTARKVLVK